MTQEEYTTKLDYSICYELDIFRYYCFYYYPFFQFIEFVKTLFTISFVLFSGTACATLIVSKFFHMPAQLSFEKLYHKNKELYEYIPFLLEELEEYYALEEDKDKEFIQTLINKYIYYSFKFREKDYKIIMNYNHLDESFEYFLNDKSYTLPFAFLDTVARIYSVKYNCRNIYIDNYNNRQILIDSLNPLETTTENQDTDKNKNPEADIFYTKKHFQTIDSKKTIHNYKSISCKYKGLFNEFSDLIVGFDMYNSTDTMIASICQLDNEIFHTKKIDDTHILDTVKKFLSFKDFKDSIKS